MKRREFFRRFAIGAVGLAAAPQLVESLLTEYAGKPRPLVGELVGCMVVIVNGTGRGEVSMITHYEGESPMVPENSWSTAPDESSQFLIVLDDGFQVLPPGESPK